MKIVSIKLSDLHPAKRNVRMHPPEQIEEYKRSLVKNGQIKPIVVDENNEILIGNGLYAAALALEWDKVDCLVKTGLSSNDKKKLMLSDNRIFSLGTDDLSVFDEFIAELDGDFDIPGYSDELLNSLIMNNEETTETLMEYGMLDDEDKEPIIRAAEAPAVSPAPIQTTAPEADSGGREVEIDTRKYVICPKCGEKIWL